MLDALLRCFLLLIQDHAVGLEEVLTLLLRECRLRQLADDVTLLLAEVLKAVQCALDAPALVSQLREALHLLQRPATVVQLFDLRLETSDQDCRTPLGDAVLFTLLDVGSRESEQVSNCCRDPADKLGGLSYYSTNNTHSQNKRGVTNPLFYT